MVGAAAVASKLRYLTYLCILVCVKMFLETLLQHFIYAVNCCATVSKAHIRVSMETIALVPHKSATKITKKFASIVIISVTMSSLCQIRIL